MNTAASNVNHRQSTGTVAPGFEPIRNELDSMLLADPEYSCQLAIYWHDALVVDLAGGVDLTPDSLTGVYSASKGIAAVTLSTLIASGDLDLDQKVAHYWPEFAQQGKDRLLVRELLCHKAGLANVDGGLTQDELIHSELAAAKLAAQLPQWYPGSMFGYHGLTIGVFMEELVRRITGDTLQNLYESRVRAPRDIDFYLGLPASLEPRFQRVLPMKPSPEQSAFIASQAISPDSITSLVYNCLNEELDVIGSAISPNNRAFRAAGPAGVGGVGSARGLAGVYASAIGNLGTPLLDASTIAAISQEQSWGIDRTLNIQMCFAVVFMKPQPRMDFGSYKAFGHDGTGGALAFADPLHDMAFGYIPMPMAFPGGADPKAIKLAQIARRIIHGLGNS